MYNPHRGIVQPPTNNNNRLSDLFDQIRREFDVHAQDRAGEHDQNSKLAYFRSVVCTKVRYPSNALSRRSVDRGDRIHIPFSPLSYSLTS